MALHKASPVWPTPWNDSLPLGNYNIRDIHTKTFDNAKSYAYLCIIRCYLIDKKRKGDLVMGRIINVLLVIGIILLVLWLLGFLTGYTFNGYVHIALVIALICVVVWVVWRLVGARR